MIRDQIAGPARAAARAAASGSSSATCCCLCLMLAASFIDIDEKTIPDEITVPGTMLGLALATMVPMSLLPHVAERIAPPVAGVEIANAQTARPGGSSR